MQLFTGHETHVNKEPVGCWGGKNSSISDVLAKVWSCSLGWELSSWFQTGAKMSKGDRFGDSMEVQAGLGLLFLSHIWHEPHRSKGDKYQFDKQRGSGGSLEKTSSSKTKLLDHPSVPDWCSGGCSQFWDILVFAFPHRSFDQHSNPGSWFFHLPLTYTWDKCIWY